jgi:cell division protein FtsQ
MRLSAHSLSAPKGRRASRNQLQSGKTRARGKKNLTATRRKSQIWAVRLRVLRFGSVALAVAALIGGTWWLNATGRLDAAASGIAGVGFDVSRSAGLVIDDVLVEGRDRVEQFEILDALDIERGMPIMAFSPHNARERLAQIGWIESAEVTRTFPGTIFVKLTEREPMAVWQRHGRLSLIDHQGVVITETGLDAFSELLLVVGDAAPHHARTLIDTLETFPEIETEVVAAVWISDRRWDLVLQRGTKVRLPAGDVSDALGQLLEMERDYTVLGQEVVSIDLRIPDRLVVRLPSPDDIQDENKAVADAENIPKTEHQSDTGPNPDTGLESTNEDTAPGVNSEDI